MRFSGQHYSVHIFTHCGQKEIISFITPHKEESSMFGPIPNMPASLPLADFLHAFSATNGHLNKITFSEFCESFQQITKTECGSGKLLNLQLLSEVKAVLCPSDSAGWVTLDTMTVYCSVLYLYPC